MKKKNKFNLKLLIGIVLLIFIIICVLFFANYKNDDKKLTQEEEVLENIDKVFLNKDTNSEAIFKLMETKVATTYIMMGKGSFLRSTPKVPENLNSYKKVQNKYVDKIENIILENSKYEITDTRDGNIYFDITPWYYDMYASDVMHLSSRLMKMNGVSNDPEKNTNYSVDEYKSRVKAMQIIDRKLDNYYNTENEVLHFKMFFVDGKPYENQYLSLYFNLAGVTSKTAIMNQAAYEKQTKRIDGYIDEAIKNGILDKNNPYEL